MPYYVLEYDTNKDGERHVHLEKSDCYRMPKKDNQLALGFHDDCFKAMDKANEMYDNINACFNCCMECYERPKKIQEQS
ncbi:MAG: hypothetical protein CMC96_15035 [Flavobacteriales bacterium]|nr:hypothetical protein [Flavobacteriales bacterium]|tara:strand:- start:31877 stop:32113 length:237 start_codon:yes stop_codon:yes gene_type:complete